MIETWTVVALTAIALLPPPGDASAGKAPTAGRARRVDAPATTVERGRGALERAPAPFAAAPWYSSVGQLHNLDASGHDLEMRCDQQLLTSRIGARERVLLVDPARAGCTVKVVDTGRTLTLPAGSGIELVIENGALRQTAVPLVWSVHFASYGNVQSWPSGLVRQWAQRATASSEYSTAGWSAQQATGAPTLAACADSSSAWTTKSMSSPQPEWIELRYASRVRAVGARLYVTLTPGAVRRIEGKTGAGWETLWQGTDPTASCPAVLELKFNEEIDTDTLRVALDTSQQSYWFELDAVELLGKPLR
ncbi:MAG: hypothetical protein JXR83_05850 [Deltaproteobacteria bacterium]|nr:hypothetical protein [Deltaproteobacteria bacterium]